MPTTTSVYDFVAKARSQQVEDGDIRRRLFNAGWDDVDIDQILSDELVPPPPPGQNGHVNLADTTAPKQTSMVGLESFLMLLSMGISAIAGGVILHELVDVIVGGQSLTGEGSTVAIAFLMVSLPTFGVFFVHLRRLEQRDPAILQNEGRRRALQVTLVVTFLVALGRFVAWFVGLLSPELRVTDLGPGVDLGHVVVTVALAGGVFGWSWREFNRSEIRTARPRSTRRAVISIALIAAATIAAGIGQSVVTSGARHDEVLEDDLSAISLAIHLHHVEHSVLPVTLDELELDPLVANRAVDEITYRPTASTSYELCATFETDTINRPGFFHGQFGEHEAGFVCFDLDGNLYGSLAR